MGISSRTTKMEGVSRLGGVHSPQGSETLSARFHFPCQQRALPFNSDNKTNWKHNSLLSQRHVFKKKAQNIFFQIHLMQ